MFGISLRPSIRLARLPARLYSTKTADILPLPSANNRQNLDFEQLKYPTKVPQQPHISSLGQPRSEDTRIEIDDKTVQLLERLSLVDLDSKTARKTLEDSIEFASRILVIDTEIVEPLYTVLEREKLTLREDAVTDGNIQQDVLANAKVTEEEYFVAPPGNIPLEQDKPQAE